MFLAGFLPPPRKRHNAICAKIVAALHDGDKGRRAAYLQLRPLHVCRSKVKQEQLFGRRFQKLQAGGEAQGPVPQGNALGQGLLVYLAVREKRKGLDIEALRDYVERTKDHVCHWFTVDDLNHLKRGGRVSATAALFGTMLSVKPVLHVDGQGRLIPMEKCRGRKASLLALVDHMEKTAVDPERYPVFISHGDCREDAEFVAEEVRRRLGVKEVYFNYVGPVIGAHSGPGTVALFYAGTER